MNYKRFEELPCWNKARELCQAVYEIINQGKFRKDFSLRDQMWRSAGSVMDNITEGFDAGPPREFMRFLGYSQRSCSEVQSQLYRALDCEASPPRRAGLAGSRPVNMSLKATLKRCMSLLLNVANRSRGSESICGITILPKQRIE